MLVRKKEGGLPDMGGQVELRSEEPSRKKQKIIGFFQELWLDTLQTSWTLFKITIPVIIITKVLEELGLIKYLSLLLEPVMGLVGLPGELGLVWATGMFTSLYGGVAVFASLAPALDLTIAQVTILGSIMLIAHSLPVELSVSKKAGAPLLPIALIRLIGALVYGGIVHKFCASLEVWQDPAVILFKAASETGNYLDWSMGQMINLGMIVVVIFIILIGMKIFKVIGLLDLIERLLNPVLPLFGMSKRAAPIIVVGMILGIGYGGALIIRETSLGKLKRKEIFNSMALMGLCHSMFEDTLLMMAIGGKLTGLLLGRMVFALGVVYLLVKGTDWLEKRRTKEEAFN